MKHEGVGATPRHAATHLLLVDQSDKRPRCSRHDLLMRLPFVLHLGLLLWQVLLEPPRDGHSLRPRLDRCVLVEPDLDSAVAGSGSLSDARSEHTHAEFPGYSVARPRADVRGNSGFECFGGQVGEGLGEVFRGE